MCGRYIPNTEAEIMEIRDILTQISIRLSQTEIENLSIEGDIYPSKAAPVVFAENDTVRVDNMRFGFKKWDNKGIIINAKSETVNRSGFFSPHIKNRCVVPAHGFYEWRTVSKSEKIKYEFTYASRAVMMMAGIYRYTDTGGEYVILTQQADENIKCIHDRMPLMIGAEQLTEWLDGSLDVGMIRKNDTVVFSESV